MNDRIKELCARAISDVDGIQNPDTQHMYIPDCFAEKFAELIAYECIDLALGSSHREDDMGAIIANKIKQHFGVEL